MKAASQKGSSLCYASPELGADRELVVEAVSQDPHALQHATPELSGDPGTGASILLAGMNLTRNTSPPPWM